MWTQFLFPRLWKGRIESGEWKVLQTKNDSRCRYHTAYITFEDVGCCHTDSNRLTPFPVWMLFAPDDVYLLLRQAFFQF